MKLVPYAAPPLECFGLAHAISDPICINCQFKIECAEKMGRRLNRVTLDKANISLIPEAFGLATIGDLDMDERDLQAVFTACHRMVFGVDSYVSLSRYRKTILSNARKCRCSLRMFLVTNMVGHKKAYPRDQFDASMLADNRSLNRVAQYASVCKSKFAAFDLTALDVLTGSDNRDFDIEKRMYDSEMVAAGWIIDYKLRHSGKPFDMLFEEKELSFDPNWLAIEPSYEKFVRAELKTKTDGDLREFRHSVIQTIGRLKGHRHNAIANFKAREGAVKQTLVDVLAGYRLKPDHFEMEFKPVTDPLHLWNRLALAIQHVECRRFLDGDKSVYSIVANKQLPTLDRKGYRPQ